jgi:hypothetical protein
MGMQRLKIKNEIRYRKGHTNESQNCRFCINYRVGRVFSGRCKLIGFGTSKRYDVRADYTCDRQEFDRSKATWLSPSPPAETELLRERINE